MNTRFTRIAMPIMAVTMLILSLTGGQVSAYAHPLPNPGPTTCPTGQFLAQYYNNISPDANLALTRCEGEINRDWGNGSPDGGVRSDSFAARWKGNFDFAGGDYTFIAQADDGVRLWVDENLILDAWKDQVPTEYRANVALSGGVHEVKMEYYERRGEAVARLKWGERDCAAGQYLAQYYNNNILQGAPVYTVCEENINHYWGNGGPGHGVGSDNFSARWTGYLNFTGGDYTFVAQADDGLRLWVDERLLVDAWKDQPPTEYRASIKLGSGVHEVKVEYYERQGEAVAHLWWGNTPCPAGQYLAQYYSNTSLSGNPGLTRCEAAINYDWGSGGPGVGNDNFSARWKGNLNFAGGDYTFVVRADDGVRLWVDENLLIDAWKDQVPTEYRASVKLSGGAHEVKMEYYEHLGGAVAQLKLGGVDCATGQYFAQYYNNNILQGTPVYTACEKAINYSWSNGGPGHDVGNDDFSVRWKGNLDFAGGDYTFVVRADDGIRLWVDENLLIDAWKDQPPTEYRASIKLGSGVHEVKVEYYERRVEAVAYLWWGNTPCPAGQYLAEYYNNISLEGKPTLTRCEAAINYNWNSGGPGNGVGNDNFSARWKGTFDFAGGDYTFTARADDGIRLWVDERLILDAWKDQPATKYRVSVNLSSGPHEVKVHYYERIGQAVAQVRWQ